MSDTNISLVDFLTFDRMVTPLLIKIIYYLSVGIWILIGMFTMMAGMNAYFGGGMMIFGGLAIMVLGPLFARIGCEFTIVIFNIHTRLRSIDTTLKEEQKVSVTQAQG